MIQLHTLGTVDLRDASGQRLSAVLSQPKRLALLTYLAAEAAHESYRRDILIALFWPDVDEPHARMNLRKALHLLRGSLGEDVLVGSGEEQVALARSAFWCDAAAFQEAVLAGRWAEAMELYRGEFLAGFHLSGNLPFERWLESRREGLRRMATESATELAKQEEQGENIADALKWSRRALDLAPFDEEALRRVLSVLDRLGDRAEALRTYEMFAARMLADLDVEPSPETQALAERIRERRENRWETPEEVRPRRLRHRNKPRLPGTVGVWGAALAVLIAIAAVAALNLSDTEKPAASDRVVVARFENSTGDSTLEPLGTITADWISQGLAQTGLVQVVTAPSVAFLERSVDERADGLSGLDRALALAQESGAAIAVWGTYYLTGDSLEFQLHATDASDGTLLGSVGPVTGGRNDPIPAVDVLRQRAMGLLASRLDARLEDWPFQELQHPPKYDAYLQFVAGLEDFGAASNQAAIEHFDRAVALDSSLTIALFLSFIAHLSPSQFAAADSIAREVERSLHRLPPPLRLNFERYKAHLRGDLGAAYRAAQRAVELAPDDWNVANLARAAMSLGRYQEAVDLYSSLRPDRGFARARPAAYWKCLQACLHFLGEHEREAEVAREAQQLYPGSAYYLDLEIEALAAMGRFAEVQQRLDEGLTLPGFSGYHIRTAGYELSLHGHEEEAAVIFDRAIAWFEARPESEKQTLGFRQGLAGTLLMAGRWQEAAPYYEALASEYPESVEFIGKLATFAAYRGQREEALHISERLRDLDTPNLNGRNTLARAGIAAHLGEREDAVRLLKQAISEGMGYEYIHWMANFESLQDYPPYQELVRPKR